MKRGKYQQPGQLSVTYSTKGLSSFSVYLLVIAFNINDRPLVKLCVPH